MPWRGDNGNEVYDDGEEGVFDAAGTYDQGCGRVVAMGDDASANADLDWNDNDSLMRGLLSWVTQGQHSAAPPALPGAPTMVKGLDMATL